MSVTHLTANSRRFVCCTAPQPPALPPPTRRSVPCSLPPIILSGRERRRRDGEADGGATPAPRRRLQCSAHCLRERTRPPRQAMPPRPAPPPRPRRVRMCDVPAASIVTTIRDTVSCSWIFYSNSSQSTSAGAGEVATGQPPAAPDPDLDSMHMMLDPHLRPISPDLGDETSKQIFEEHKQLAQEYLKVQTELAYLSKHKAELESQMDDEVLLRKREVIQLENEKKSLIKLFCNLKKELGMDDRWVLLSDERPSE